jgi:hypothetical protein
LEKFYPTSKEKWDLIEIVSGGKEHQFINAGITSSINNYVVYCTWVIFGVLYLGYVVYCTLAMWCTVP